MIQTTLVGTNKSVLQPDNDTTDNLLLSVAVASMGDYGFHHNQWGRELFPAAWNETEWEWWLNEPLATFIASNKEAIAEIVKSAFEDLT